MAYTKTTWSDRVVQYIRRYRDELNNQKTFTPDEGTITNAGTAVTATLMNKIEQGIFDNDATLDAHLAELTHKAGKIYAYKNIGGAL